MSEARGERLCILLGAGASMAVGMPSARELTNRVVNGDAVWHHTDGTYYLGEGNPHIPDGYTPRAVAVVRWVASYLERHYFASNRTVTYEDIFFVLDQIRQAENWEYENPALQPFIHEMLSGFDGLLSGRERESRESWTTNQLIDEAWKYVRDVVWHLLRPVPDDLDGLGLVTDACKSRDGSLVDICTLNHDVVLEEHLRQRAMHYVDGFGESTNGIRYWSPDSFHDAGGVRLLKLHGSVNWFYFISRELGLSVGIPDTWDVWHTTDIRGEMQWSAEGRPEFLCGTFNKILYYQNPIYADLHFQFFASLKSATRMVVAGYGFGDKAVNRRLWDWMQRGETSMVVIHPDPSALIAQARPAMADGFKRWRDQSRLAIVAQGLQSCAWRDVSDVLGAMAT